MGFPDLKYMDSDVEGPPVKDQTFYRQFKED